MDRRLELLKSANVFCANKIFNLAHPNFMINVLDFFSKPQLVFTVSALFNNQVLLFFIYIFCNGEYTLDNITRNWVKRL